MPFTNNAPPAQQGPPEGGSTAPRHAACGGPIPSSAEGLGALSNRSKAERKRNSGTSYWRVSSPHFAGMLSCRPTRLLSRARSSHSSLACCRPRPGRLLSTAAKPATPTLSAPTPTPPAAGFSYVGFAKAYPFANNVLIATCKTSAADLVAQCAIERKPLSEVDWRRNMVFCLFGAVYLGAFQYWYQVREACAGEAAQREPGPTPGAARARPDARRGRPCPRQVNIFKRLFSNAERFCNLSLVRSPCRGLLVLRHSPSSSSAAAERTHPPPAPPPPPSGGQADRPARLARPRRPDRHRPLGDPKLDADNTSHRSIARVSTVAQPQSHSPPPRPPPPPPPRCSAASTCRRFTSSRRSDRDSQIAPDRNEIGRDRPSLRQAGVFSGQLDPPLWLSDGLRG